MIMLEELKAQIDFNPVFWILDTGRCKAMAVKRDDKYEFFGVSLEIKDLVIESYPACMSKGHLHEFRSNYEFTKDSESALQFLIESQGRVRLTTEQMQGMHHDPDIIY